VLVYSQCRWKGLWYFDTIVKIDTSVESQLPFFYYSYNENHTSVLLFNFNHHYNYLASNSVKL